MAGVMKNISRAVQAGTGTPGDRMSCTLLLFLSLACPAFSAPAAKAGDATFHQFTLKKAGFRCEIPAWEERNDPEADESQKVFGVFLVGPRPPVGPVPSISIDFYAPGNAFFPSAKAYLQNERKQREVPLEDEWVSPFFEIKVAGKKATSWSRTYKQPAALLSSNHEPVPMRDEQVLLQAASGFSLLAYTATVEQSNKYRKDFQHVLDTFQILPAAKPKK
jgi:hypothetical protein